MFVCVPASVDSDCFVPSDAEIVITLISKIVHFYRLLYISEDKYLANVDNIT